MTNKNQPKGSATMETTEMPHLGVINEVTDDHGRLVTATIAWPDGFFTDFEQVYDKNGKCAAVNMGEQYSDEHTDDIQKRYLGGSIQEAIKYLNEHPEKESHIMGAGTSKFMVKVYRDTDVEDRGRFASGVPTIE